jgi:xylulokinase
MEKILAYDLGTGGIKASLFDAQGVSVASSFIQYDTYYPFDKFHEQRPMDWWKGVCESTKILLGKSGVPAKEIQGVAVSGASLVSVPIGVDGSSLLEKVPIWSDTRATDQREKLFHIIPYKDWYMTTGNGFPAECYSVFKLMWMRVNMPDIFAKTVKVLGTKDFINYLFTGEMYTDYSYASGTGMYELKNARYCDAFINAANIPKEILPQIVSSHTMVGRIRQAAAAATGLVEGTPVLCGGVDNACMALGAKGIQEGRIYTSLGSSSWIAITSSQPILDVDRHPFVFAHIIEGMFTSALSIFSAGNSLRWVRDNICRSGESYKPLDELAAKVPVGSNGILFNPSLAGGTAQDKSINIRGAFMGLSLGNTYADIVRATMEGIALNLRLSLDGLRQYCRVDEEMLFCGGGSKSDLWRQIFADIYNMDIVKTNIDQDAASLGAAAIAAKGCGLWQDYNLIDQIHQVQSIKRPVKENVVRYEQLLKIFEDAADKLADIGDSMRKVCKS